MSGVVYELRQAVHCLLLEVHVDIQRSVWARAEAVIARVDELEDQVEFDNTLVKGLETENKRLREAILHQHYRDHPLAKGCSGCAPTLEILNLKDKP